MFVYAIYPDEERAANAVRGLVDAGFPMDLISSLLHREEEADAQTGSSRGELLGTVLRSLGGAMPAATDNYLVTGTLFAALQGGTGFGAIAGLEFWPEEVESMKRRLAEGDVVVAVETIAEHQATAERTLQAAQAKAVGASRSVDAAVGEN